MRRREDEKKRRCEDVRIRTCEDVKMFDRPPLLEEPFAQTLSGKSGPSMVCFVHFDFEMCFAPQRRTLFRHLNFKKCSECAVFLAFSLANVLRATTACNFSPLIWPDGSAPAALASLLFDPPEPQIIGKT